MADKSLINRMVRAAKLDADLYEEVEADKSATWHAFLAVFIVSLAVGIGSVANSIISGDTDTLLWGLLISIGSSITGWLLWAIAVYYVGIIFFKTRETEADYGQLLRTLGFATTPGILGFFVFIPVLGGLLVFIGLIWRLIAGVVAVRQALDFSTWRAIGTCLVGLIPYAVLNFMLGLLIVGGSYLF